MLVVIPVCGRDLALATLNLQLAAKLDARCPFPALISAPTGLNISDLERRACKWFSSVSVFRYIDWSGPKTWPRPQNWAWQSAARHIATLSPAPDYWFWWEADAAPLTSGWFTSFSQEYARGGKPFAGQLVGRNGHKQQTSGVALYPADVRPYCSDAFITRATPFDCLLCSQLSAQIHPLTHLIGHYFKPAGRPSFVATLENIAELRSSGLVFYHGSSDGSLVRTLLAPVSFSASIGKLVGSIRSSFVSATPVSDVTVVITNYQRPEMLWRAFESCLRAKVAHIIISSSGATPAVEAVHARIMATEPSTVITSRRDDAGCNECWLRGASLAKTSRLTLLHDDDILLPAYESVAAGVHDADVIHWDGSKHNLNGPFSGTYVTAGTLPTGTYPISYLYQHLLNPQANSLSPVSGCFPTTHVISTLEECEKNFGKWAYLRPTMMVGNDLLLWLRACQKFRTFHYSHDPFCSYGHHLGSASYDDATQNRMKLLPIYKATRAYFTDSLPRLIHAINRFLPSDPANRARIRTAAESWDIAYHYEFIVPRHQWAWHRDATSIGEKVPTPFLRDLLTRAIRDAKSKDDLIVITNDDTIINQYFWFAALDWLRDKGAGCSFRRNISSSESVNCWLYPENPVGVQHCGRDAFFFTQEWLDEHLQEIPDYIVGFCDWDSTLAMLIRLVAGYKSKPEDFSREHPFSELESRFIYHVEHSANWASTFSHRGNQHSRALTEEWFKKNLGWPMPKLREGKW